MTEPDATRRWEGDERGAGVADAAPLARRLERFAEHADRPEWVAEAPEAHLWPHLRAAIESAGSPWRTATRSTTPDGCLVVELEHASEADDRGPARLRGDALALIARVAEGSTFIDVGDEDGVLVVDAVTGMMDDQTRFRSHGHTLRLRIRAR
jgi:hypothetical protein